MRKVLFTESQLKGILGENFDTYLPKKGYAAENPDNSYGTEVSLTDNDLDNNPVDTVTTDKIAKSRVCAIPRLRRIAENKINLDEENQELIGHSYNLGKSVNGLIDNMASQNPNDKLLQNMSSEKNMKHGTAKKRKHDLEQMKKNDPQRFQNINGERLLKNINGKLDTDRNMSKSHKEFKRDILGYSNAFQKEGGTKNNTSSVMKNNMMITYQD